jgi:hypothetical protein
MSSLFILIGFRKETLYEKLTTQLHQQRSNLHPGFFALQEQLKKNNNLPCTDVQADKYVDECVCRTCIWHQAIDNEFRTERNEAD